MAPLSSIAAILICLCSMTVATPLLSRQTTADVHEACTTLHQRKAWHDLTSEDKSAYIEAELCLMNSPPRTGHPLAQNRWDEFTITHTVQTQWVHNVGAFLPWHRYFVLAHENALRYECNYTGYQPYWEETLDMEDLASSLLFDLVTGFGGQGGECLDDGPFSNLLVMIHVSYNFTSLEFYADNRCVSRSFDNEFFLTGNQTSVDDCSAIEDGISLLIATGPIRTLLATAVSAERWRVPPLQSGTLSSSFTMPMLIVCGGSGSRSTRTQEQTLSGLFEIIPQKLI